MSCDCNDKNFSGAEGFFFFLEVPLLFSIRPVPLPPMSASPNVAESTLQALNLINEIFQSEDKLALLEPGAFPDELLGYIRESGSAHTFRCVFSNFSIHSILTSNS